jgi:hypothetical protein
MWTYLQSTSNKLQWSFKKSFSFVTRAARKSIREGHCGRSLKQRLRIPDTIATVNLKCFSLPLIICCTNWISMRFAGRMACMQHIRSAYSPQITSWSPQGMRVLRQCKQSRAEVMFVTIHRENIRPQRKKWTRLLQCNPNCPMFAVRLWITTSPYRWPIGCSSSTENLSHPFSALLPVGLGCTRSCVFLY